MRGRRLWLKVETAAGLVRVYVVKQLEDEDGHDLEGIFLPDTNEVLVRQIDAVVSMKSTLHHELTHVALRFAVASVQREENLIRELEPQQFDILTRNGWLRYPNPPRVK